MEKVEDTRCIGDNRMNRRQAISPVDGAIFKDSRFLNIDDGIDAEAADALIEPEIGGVVQCLADLGIFPVEVRLFSRKGMQVILLPFFTPGPR